jgi:hypothetical protein
MALARTISHSNMSGTVPKTTPPKDKGDRRHADAVALQAGRVGQASTAAPSARRGGGVDEEAPWRRTRRRWRSCGGLIERVAVRAVEGGFEVESWVASPEVVEIRRSARRA